MNVPARLRAQDATKTAQPGGKLGREFDASIHQLSLALTANGTFLDTGWAKIDNFSALCKKHSIKVILCLHAAPGAQNGELMPTPWTAPPTLVRIQDLPKCG